MIIFILINIIANCNIFLDYLDKIAYIKSKLKEWFKEQDIKKLKYVLSIEHSEMWRTYFKENKGGLYGI